MAQSIKFVEGNVGQVHELRHVGQDNRAVVDFSIAATPRRKNANDEWEDGETVWTNCTAWNKPAENIAETWKPGDQVFARGREEMKAGYTNKNGDEVPARPVLIVDLIGHDERWFPATQDRAYSGGNSKPAGVKKPAAEKKAAPAKDAELLQSSNADLEEDFPF